MKTRAEQIKSHPLCAYFNEDVERVLVLFPHGTYPEGARVKFTDFTDKDAALERLLASMNRIRGHK